MGEDSMPKLIQICASENDLFGLDGDGNAYQYNFSTSVWTTLGRRRDSEADGPSREPFSSPSARRRPPADARASD